MMPGMTLKQKGLSLVALLLLIELSFVGVLTVVLFQSEQSTRFEASAKDIVIGLNEVIFDIMRMEHFSFRYIGTAQDENRIEFWNTLPRVKRDMKLLLQRAESFPSMKERIHQVAGYTEDCVKLEEKMVRMFMAGQHGPANDVRHGPERDSKGHRMINEIKLLQDEMQPIIKEQSGLASQSQLWVMRLLLAGFACNVLLAIYLSLAFVKGITSRLTVLADNSRRLAADQALNPPLGQDDEIGKLDAMFHKMSEDVKESARKERALTDNARDVICSLSADGRLLKINPAASKNWGYTNAELLEKKIAALLPADERTRFQALLDTASDSNMATHGIAPTNMGSTELASVPGRGEPCSPAGGDAPPLPSGDQDQEIEFQIVSKNGNVTDTIWAMHWSEYDQCFFCVVHDISERKQAERLLRASEARSRTVIDSMLVGLLTVNERGTIVSVNPRTEQLLEQSSDELNGKVLSKLFPQLQIDNSDSAMSALFHNQSKGSDSNEKTVHLSQLECKRKAGGVLQIELWLTELPSSKQEDNYLVNIIDVSARHEIQKAKQEFVAVIRNDLRTPLSAVENYLRNFSSQSQEKLRDDGKRKSELAMSNIGGLLRLIDDLLEINNLESGQLALNCQEMDLQEVIQRSLEAVRGFAEQHKIKLQYKEASSLNIWADPDRLGRIIINLLSNAIKFSPTDETVSVVVERIENDVCVKIIDRGRGVPESHKELIFERFKQVKSSDATQKGGTGLGLAICKAIIEQHGGSIAVDSEEGKGSCFWFRIPSALPAAAKS